MRRWGEEPGGGHAAQSRICEGAVEQRESGSDLRGSLVDWMRNVAATGLVW